MPDHVSKGLNAVPTLSNPLSNDSSETSASSKLPYVAPQLIYIGSVRALTLTGGVSVPDGPLNRKGRS